MCRLSRRQVQNKYRLLKVGFMSFAKKTSAAAYSVLFGRRQLTTWRLFRFLYGVTAKAIRDIYSGSLFNKRRNFAS